MDQNGRARQESQKKKKQKRPPRPKRNPIEAAIRSWYEKYTIVTAYLEDKQQHGVDDLVAQAPKRWTAYGPLVLLPAGSFTSAAWRDVLSQSTTTEDEEENVGNNNDGVGSNEGHCSKGQVQPVLPSSSLSFLWKAILDEIAGTSNNSRLTHLAVNEGIPLHSKTSSDSKRGAEEERSNDIREKQKSENIIRSPSGLRILYGDFGPSTLLPPTHHQQTENTPIATDNSGQPTSTDLAHAFWVSTKQNNIIQTWAPRWTMFSRGNVKEKERLLDFHSFHHSRDGGANRRYLALENRKGRIAVDLYAGIGYFAFCYAALGFRVLCWELNPWSVEGLRRGAGENGWSVRVVRFSPPPSSEHSSGKEEGEKEEEDKMLRDVLVGDETIVVFLEDNKRAVGRLRRLDELSRGRQRLVSGNDDGGGSGTEGGLWRRDVVHVNCGLLPTSTGSWATAWDAAREGELAWIHVHENVGVADIRTRKLEIQEWFVERAVEDDDGHRDRGKGDEEDVARGTTTNTITEVHVEHVELVKTFAPDVWHCVFDLCIQRRQRRDSGIGNLK